MYNIKTLPLSNSLKYVPSYRHGGDIYNNDVKYDFSVNTNPLGLPFLVKRKLAENTDVFAEYPDMQCRQLCEELSMVENIPGNKLLFGNGASEIFKLAVDAIKPRKALVTAPSFLGYSYVLNGAGAGIEYYYLQEEKNFVLDIDILGKIPASCDMVFLCSPCNPTGRIISKDILLNVLSYCEENNIYLVVDECFLGFVPDYEMLSMKSELHSKYLIVVNAFTKLYAMAGLRLGWCACGNGELLGTMRRMQPEWSVSVPAQMAGVYALKDKDYIVRTKELIHQEKAKMEGFLENNGIKVFPSDANFLLVKSKINLYKKFLEKRVLIRQCNNFAGLSDGFYRIAIRSAEENSMFNKILMEVI
ncbi:MAG: aminotransferase class I/II-fold pyridoxal phosphate-dependent enzyme [Lachnospiraceae bacterium]|nr:aminotransferase class I/II-fold pyridoxal phosphate-dependent enzyme [Lachnospiraceae bacterium]